MTRTSSPSYSPSAADSSTTLIFTQRTVTASLFSPVWSQNGNSAVKVHSLELAAEVKTAEGVLRRANTGLRPEARQALQMSQFELREQQELESHMYKGMFLALDRDSRR